ncbi:ComC/BlpC family leader-containing pheromone/bacteriocin [Chitinophaga pendula]|uniref:ComC/BlpC family leader-containing pheromone/bacteriocin n=1 Tax=Chitinophaga TaxID=79328 RepID=UPI0012FD6DCB|nr:MULTISPECIES: ComC/BlpC family leader-containing pheromone/bacteriocin [Chitinophaga]UCJ10099.1 ComC/BlpC family leader-containing pheromone/bacteriocin [Chitinophaga pendula]
MKKTLHLHAFETLSRTDLQDIHGGGVYRRDDFCIYFCVSSPEGWLSCGPTGRCSCQFGYCSMV